MMCLGGVIAEHLAAPGHVVDLPIGDRRCTAWPADIQVVVLLGGKRVRPDLLTRLASKQKNGVIVFPTGGIGLAIRDSDTGKPDAQVLGPLDVDTTLAKRRVKTLSVVPSKFGPSQFGQSAAETFRLTRSKKKRTNPVTRSRLYGPHVEE